MSRTAKLWIFQHFLAVLSVGGVSCCALCPQSNTLEKDACAPVAGQTKALPPFGRSSEGLVFIKDSELERAIGIESYMFGMVGGWQTLSSLFKDA